MRHLLILFALLSLGTLGIIAPAEAQQEDPMAEPSSGGEEVAESAVDPTAGKAVLTFYRNKRSVGAAANTSVYIDGVEIAELDNGTYIRVALEPGRHTFRSDRKKDSFDLEVEAGEEYYIRIVMKVGQFSGYFGGHGKLFFMNKKQGKSEFQRENLKPANDVRVPGMVLADGVSSNP